MHRPSLLALAFLFAAFPAAAQSFEGLGDLPGGQFRSSAAGVSADGTVVVGYSYAAEGSGTAFRWTADDGMQELGVLAAGNGFSSAAGVSADGTVVVGERESGDGREAFRWTADDGMEGLGFLTGPEPSSTAFGVSADGAVVVGASDYQQPENSGGEGFRWENGTMIGLGDLPGGSFDSEARAVSADGTVIAGNGTYARSHGAYGGRAFRWTADGGLQPLPFLPGGEDAHCVAHAISDDGTVIVGTSVTLGGSDLIYEAARWLGGEVFGLGHLPGSTGYSVALAASADGSVIVGDGGSGEGAFIWTEADGIRNLRKVLEDLGLDLTGWTLTRANALSDDGTVVVGWGSNPSGQTEAWRTVLVPDAIVVTETGDAPNHPDSQAADLCDVDRDAGGNQCTLRAALELANERPGADSVAFDLDDEPLVIAPASPLPAITEALELDGFTQPGTEDVPLIRLDGAGTGDADGLVLSADDVTIRGLIITGFGGHGIHVTGGDDGVLEGLIVGTDASGTDGLGNGGDGIRLSGGKGWRVGSGDAAAGKRADIGRLVTLAGNVQSGLCAIDPANAARVLAWRAGSGAEPTSTNLTLVGLVVGIVDAAVGAIPRPNGAHGLCLEGTVDARIDEIRVSDAIEHAVHVMASQKIDVRRAVMGLRPAAPSSGGLVGSIGGSAFRIAESVDVTIGSENPADAPVEGGGAAGWFVEVEDAQDVRVRNVLAGLSSNVEQLSDGVRQALHNLSGGMSVTDSPNVTVGALGVRTIFANNGGDASKPQAGFFATGEATRALRALNLHLGTTPEGLEGIGNLGDGFVLTDGVREALLGGESEEEKIVSAGNGGFGFLFRRLKAAAGLPPDQQLGSVVTAHRLVSDLVRPISGALVPMANELSGIRLDEVEAVRMSQLSIGPSLQNGLEISRSLAVEIESASVGAYWSALVQGLDDIAGPEGDGIVIEESEDIAVGRRLYEDVVVSGYRVFVVGTGGRGLYAHQSARTRLANWAAGVSVEGSEESDEIFEALGTDLEAMVVDESEDVEIANAAFLSNGRSASSGGGGLLISVSRRIEVIESLFGELLGEREARRQNFHAAIKALESQDVRVRTSRVVRHAMGIVADDTDLTLEGNTVTLQGTDGGEGTGVRITGEATVEGARNIITENTGAGFWFTDGAAGLIRHNDIEGNGQGIVVEGGGGKRGAQKAAVLAPDNWWGDASGPGGVGPGSGDAITDGVDVPSWRSAPLGVIVEPAARIVPAWAVAEISIPVTFEHPLVAADVLDVTVTDERGWVTSETSFEVAVTAASGARRTIDATLPAAGVNTVTIRAVSRAHPERSGEAVVTLGSPRHFVATEAAAEGGSKLLEADADEAFVVGGEIVINPGGANEETATIAGFGSILLAEPLRFAHAAGESIAPLNRFAVDVEEGPETALPQALSLTIFPNPTTTRATLDLRLPRASDVRVELFDLVGHRLGQVREGMFPAGRHALDLDLSTAPAGVYLLRMRVSGRTVTRTIVVVR